MPTFRPGLGDDTERYIHHEHGYLEYRFAPGGLVELVNFEVDPVHRSKGIGRSMIASLERLPGVVGLYGFLFSENRRMLSLYVRLGFRHLCIPDYYGESKDAYLIWKLLEK